MLINPATLPQILQSVESFDIAKGEVLLLLFSEEATPDIPALIEALNRKNIAFFGGTFPGLIYGDQRVSDACILKKFRILTPPFMVSGIASTTLDGLPDLGFPAQNQKGTAIVLLDGLTPNISLFLERLNDLMGEECSFIGGGAGSISLKQQPCVFSNEGFKQDAAVICVIDKRVNLGVRHGWKPMDDPLVATHTDGNTILQLNWQKAITVYGKILEKECGIALNKDNFAGIAQGYPFGILREKEDDIVRDPLAIGEDGSIVCIGEVPPNTVLHVLKGNPKTLLEAARIAVRDCGGADGLPIQAEGTFIVDCITRTLFLKDQFAEEMNIVRAGLRIDTEDQEPFGILSLGEISSYGEGLLELFNKTIVIGTFY